MAFIRTSFHLPQNLKYPVLILAQFRVNRLLKQIYQNKFSRTLHIISIKFMYLTGSSSHSIIFIFIFSSFHFWASKMFFKICEALLLFSRDIHEVHEWGLIHEPFGYKPSENSSSFTIMMSQLYSLSPMAVYHRVY